MYKWRECSDMRLEGNVEGFKNKRSSGAEPEHHALRRSKQRTPFLLL